jgi:hypothetical protein
MACTRIKTPPVKFRTRLRGNASKQNHASKAVIRDAPGSKGDMNPINVTTEKAERIALRFQNETGSVLRLVPHGRDYALYENENLLAIFLNVYPLGAGALVITEITVPVGTLS